MRRLTLLAALVAITGCSVGAPIADGGSATWALDPEDRIGPQTVELTAWVTERACASGRSSEGRIIGPDVRMDDETVVVTFRVRPQPGAQDCQGNPPTPVVVRLTEPLGERRLIDGGREPPREPPLCANPESCE
jgi:hypothetical protein